MDNALLIQEKFLSMGEGEFLMNLNFLNLTEKELDTPIYRIMKEEHVIQLFAKQRNTLLHRPRAAGPWVCDIQSPVGPEV
jgi:hypothetical protein